MSRVIAASNIVRVELEVDGSLPAGSTIGTGAIRHDGRELRFVVASLEPDGTIALLTDGGIDDASGEWTITVDDDGDARAPGPWVLRFTVP